MQRRHGVFTCFTLCLLVLGCAALLNAQVNTATLSGTVTDPQGLAVKGANITLTNAGTAAERTAVSDDSGRFKIVGLTPGRYTLKVEAGANFAPYQNESVVVTVGEDAIFNPRLDLKGVQQSVTVTTETAPIETTKTEVSQTVGERRIDNLPINGRNYINFTLTNSQVNRDVAPTIGPAPTSGLNFGGQRARSNEVSVDGADAVDNSINGIRATVSQEAVQEFQLILGDYNAEYGRATGGVVNIVTKSGGNEFHGDVFGYLRNKAFQARNAFSGQVDPATGALDPIKQAYTRVQAGLTFGGALKKDKTFYFFSYEDTQREETGFSSIGQGTAGTGPWGMVTVPLPNPQNPGGAPIPVQLTPSQAATVQALLTSGVAPLQQLGESYGLLLGSASSVAQNKLDFGAVATNFGLNPGPGQNFPVPVTCPVGATVGNVVCPATPAFPGAGFSFGMVPLPASYHELNSLRGNFPVTEKTSLWSLRLDQKWNSANSSFLRIGVSPSLVTGIESTAQNQVFGENAGSRTGLNQSRDLDIVLQHDTILSATGFNQFRFQAARRGLHFGFSQLPGGSDIGVNIPGFAYFGREPYSTVDRIERRFEFTDNVSLIRGNHTFKIGGDYNLIQLRSSKAQIFELDYGGDVNFGGLPVSDFGLPNTATLPSGKTVQLFGTTGLQSYGLGIPTTYIQGIGQSNQPFDNFPIGIFAQDSWRVNRHLAINYGVRYDIEITPLFSPLNSFNAAAEKAMGVVEGIPRDTNNVAPRLGIAWDPKGDGKMVIRSGFGLFYDHPLLAVAFDSATADGGRSVQLITAGGTASGCGVLPASSAPPGYPLCGPGPGGALDSPANLNGSTIFQGALNSLPNMFYLPNQQRFDPLAAGSLFAGQNYLAAGFPLPILPFVLPVAKNFQYGVAQQANLTIEREIAGSWKISVGYQYTKGQHLNRPVDVNSTDPQLLTQNYADCVASGLTTCSSTPVGITVPAGQLTTSNGCTFTPTVPSLVGTFSNCPGPLAFLDGTPVATAAAFNFFRPSGPNPSFAGPNAVAYPLLVGAASASCFPAGFFGAGAPAKCYPTGFGAPVAFNSVDAQLSDGNSVYHGLTVNVQKRFSHSFEMLSSYTWSHAIDDSTDLQSPLEPQDSRFPFLERSNSDFDQRHRWVTSAVLQSPSAQSGDSAWKHFIGDFTLSPIIEASSGRPYTVITGTDYRLDLGASNGRPSVGPTGSGTTSSFIPGVTFVVPTTCLTTKGQAFSIPGITPPFGCDGNLGRNPFVTPGFFQFDMRLSRRFNIGERLKMDVIADGFNLTNRLNVAAVNQLCDPGAGATCSAGQPTAAYDARQFQFALKLLW